jgi:hypothetical protein
MPLAATSIVISHWYKLIEGLQASPRELYASIERALENRKIPNAEESRVDWKEAGALSASREYLRMTHGKHVIDICGAPFGTGFFVSWWLAETKPSPIGPSLGALVSMFVLWLILKEVFGIFGGFFATLLAFIGAFFATGAIMSQSPEDDWVESLLVIPVVGPLWERFFCPATYYRIDTALMFQQAVHASVMEVIDGMTQAKGLRALSEADRKPILKDFFRQ